MKIKNRYNYKTVEYSGKTDPSVTGRVPISYKALSFPSPSLCGNQMFDWLGLDRYAGDRPGMWGPPLQGAELVGSRSLAC